MKKLKKIIRLLIALACIIYLVRFFYKNKDSLLLILKLDVPTIFFIIILTVSYFFIYSLRFQIVLEKCSSIRLNYIYLFKLLIQARFLNLVFSQMGNVYRGYKLKKDCNISYTRYISSFTSTLWMDTCFNLFFATTVILVLSPRFKIGYFIAWQTFLILALLISAVPVAVIFLMSKFKIKIKFLDWTHAKLTEVLSVTISNLRDTTYLLKFFSLGIIQLALTVLAHYILFKRFDLILNLPTLLVFYILLRLSIFISITPGNIGVQEIAYGFIAEQMGIGMAAGILVSVVARVLNFFIIILLGIILGGTSLLRRRKEFANLK